jgi:2-(1,2-epoxy-1,2-dihydrophenyl)acetyl-CoA isomerase
MTGTELSYAVEDGVAEITFRRPAQLNALSKGLREALRDALDRAAADEGVGAVVLTGEGRAFSVGQDVAELAALYRDHGPRLGGLVRDEYGPILDRLHRLPKPVVAAVHGPAAGGGMALAMAADIRLATTTASFIPAFVKVGLVPDSGASYYLVHMLGLSRALEVALTGEPIGAEEAKRIGLVREVYETPEAMLAAARELARGFARGPRHAYAAIKAILHAAAGTYEVVAALEAEAQDRLGRTEDHREAVAAFLERRQPAFRGR